MAFKPVFDGNRVTRICNIEYPVFSGGMYLVSNPELTASISNAGGCGILSSLSYKSVDALINGIELTKSLIKGDKPFGINFSYISDKNQLKGFGVTNAEEYVEQFLDVILSKNIKIIETTSINEETMKYILQLFSKYNRITIHKCHTIKNALLAQKYGATIISLDGFESAGYSGGISKITNLTLLSLASKYLNTPYICSGGIVNGKQLASIMCLGAEGCKLGTRFMCTIESPVNNAVKEMIANNKNEDNTVQIFNKIPTNTIRVYNNKIAQKVLKLENNQSNVDYKSIYKNNLNFDESLINGKGNDYIWSCGQSSCLIDDIISCKQVIYSIINECNQTFKAKL